MSKTAKRPTPAPAPAAPPSEPPASKPGYRVPWWIKVFVFFHLFCITVWALPNPPDSVSSGKEQPVGSTWILYGNQKFLKPLPPLQTYLFVTGFWQYWDMFAPDPAQMDKWCDAEVTYKDGTVRRYQYPRMFLLSIPMKYVKERYRKFYERADQENYVYLWAPFAQRIALVNYHDPKNPPVQVRLFRHWLKIVPPGQFQATQYNQYDYFRYVVDQARLRRDAGEQ